VLERLDLGERERPIADSLEPKMKQGTLGREGAGRKKNERVREAPFGRLRVDIAR
jgi:hypothetical protein